MSRAGDFGALRRLIEGSRRMAVLSGAGLSAECGVPDFRSPGSPWQVHKPISFADFLSDPGMRREAWRRKFAMDDIYAGARPGRGHYALTRLYKAGLLRRVITQNIDGLQQAAGLPADALIELHGNGTFARCLNCGTRHDLAPIRAAFEATGALPECRCGGIVKSASIAFGQAIPPDDLRHATETACSCDLLLVVGSSLLVRPASRFPAVARQNGARTAVINRDPTPFDASADLVIREDIGTALESVAPPDGF